MFSSSLQSVTGNGPSDAIVIGEIPFLTSGDSTGFASSAILGAGPDVFFKFTSVEVGHKGKIVASNLEGVATEQAVELGSRPSMSPSIHAVPSLTQKSECTPKFRTAACCCEQAMMIAFSAAQGISKANYHSHSMRLSSTLSSW